MWKHTPAASKSLLSTLGMQHPIVLAPMAGVCTPALTAAVSNAGGLGMYGAALTPASELQGVVRDIKARLKTPDRPFGVNLFVPPADVPPFTLEQQAALDAVHAYYANTAQQMKLDCKVEAPALDLADLHGKFEAQVQVLLDEQVPVITFYFGLPEQQLLSRIQASGAFTMGTATCLMEAQKLEAAGINGIVVQGSEAGGHRGTWYDTPGHPKQYMVGTTTLLALIASHVKHIPLLAAGGIMTGQQVVAALAAGAAAAQVGTAFLTCNEAGTPPPCRELLLNDHDRGTTVSQVFTGRPARGLVNQATNDLQQVQEQLPLSLIGVVNARPFYMAARGVTEFVMQLCGQGYPLCRECTAEELVQQLLQEAEQAAQSLAEPEVPSGH